MKKRHKVLRKIQKTAFLAKLIEEYFFILTLFKKYCLFVNFENLRIGMAYAKQ